MFSRGQRAVSFWENRHYSKKTLLPVRVVRLKFLSLTIPDRPDSQNLRMRMEGYRAERARMLEVGWVDGP